MKSIQRTAVSSSLSDRFRASNYWIRKSISIHQPEIIVFENKTKRFTLVPDQNLLEHEEEGNPGYDFFTITWKPTSKPEETTNIFTTYEADDGAFVPVVTNPDMTQTRIFSMRSTASDRPLPCVFVALGWLRERDLPSKSEGGGMQTTYYVVLLNLSTDPVSVWLMFDYHLQADDVCLYRWTNRLGDYHNRRWSPEFGKGALLPKSDDLFPGPPTADVVNRLRHLLHERSNRHRAFDTPSEHGAESVPQGDSLFPMAFDVLLHMLTAVQRTDSTSETHRQAPARDPLWSMMQTTITSPSTSLAKTIQATLVSHVMILHSSHLISWHGPARDSLRNRL